MRHHPGRTPAAERAVPPAFTSPPKPVSKESRLEPREPLQGGPLPGSEATRFGSGRRSPRGLLADIPSRITHDDIKEARREMWSGFPSSEA